MSSSDEFDDDGFDFDQAFQQIEAEETQRKAAAPMNRILPTQLTRTIPPPPPKVIPFPRRAAAVPRRVIEKPGNPFVHSNPIAAPPPILAPVRINDRLQKIIPDNSAMLEIEEEETPSIVVDGEGQYVRGNSVLYTAPSKPVERVGIQPPVRNGNQNGNQTRNQSNLGSIEWDELRQLREEKLKFAGIDRELAQAKKEIKTKSGEINVIRGRASKVEADHKSELELERAAKKALELALEEREREHRAEISSHITNQAFQKHDAETARRSSSQRPSSTARGRGQNSTARRDHAIGIPTSAARSPSLGRKINLTGAAAELPMPLLPLGNFVNSFDTSSSNKKLATASQSESMPPPPPKRTKVQKTPEKVENLTNLSSGGSGPTSREKGKGRMLEEMEEEGEEEYLMNDEEDLDGWEIEESHDYRGEVLAAILKHTTFEHFDVESSTQTASSQRISTATAKASTARLSNSSTSTATFTTRIEPNPVVVDLSPIPTFYSLTNLRFSPATPIKLVQEYSEICRELFITLGKRAEMEEMNGTEFCSEIGFHLEGMVEVLLDAGLIGPLISLLSLLSSLVLLFPGFQEAFVHSDSISLNSVASSKLLSLLGRIITIFGRPTPLAKTTRPKERKKSRTSRPTNQEVKVVDEERVELEAGKRDAIVSAAVDILTGLAWRVDEAGEGSLIRFLDQKDTMATLLDPNQSLQILTSVIQFICLLASHKRMFRSILGIKFYDSIYSTDVRNSSVPILDRIGSLLISKTLIGTPKKISLVSLVTILSTQHQDSISLITRSPSLIPELLGTIFSDVRAIWDQDGSFPSPPTLERLSLVVARLSATVHLFHYLTCSPASSLKISEFCTHSQFVGLHDRFNIAFGTLSFGNSPDWASPAIEKELLGLCYLAQDIMEDVNPDEMEEMESCFVDLVKEDEMEVDDEEELARQLH